MSDTSSDLHKALRDGQEKLTYFLLGAETAVFAYLGKDFVAEPIGLTRNTFELLGLLAFAASIIAGVLALSARVYVQKLNVEQLGLNERIRSHRLAAESGEPHINFLTGKEAVGAELLAEADTFMTEYRDLEQHMTDSSRTTQAIGVAHTCLLVVGLLLLMTSRSIGLFK